MFINTFEDIVAWQKAKELSLLTYKAFKNCRDYGFKDQIVRASISVMNNIAEGYERNGNKDFRHFLYIAKGSCAEVRSMLYVALELEYISKKDFDEIFDLTLTTSKLLSGFIKKL